MTEPAWSNIVVVQLLSWVWLFLTPWAAACQAALSFTISWSLLKFMSIGWVILSNHLILCHPLFLLLSIFPSIRSFLMRGLFVSGGEVLELQLQLQHQSFWWIFRVDFLLGLTDLISNWAAFPFSRGSSRPRDWTWYLQVYSLLSEPPGKPYDLSWKWSHSVMSNSLRSHGL